MAESPESRMVVREFHGLVTNRGALVGRPGDAQKQENLHSPGPGMLQVRKGRRALTFTGTPGGSGDVIAMHFYRAPHTDYLIWATADGHIIVGETPA